MLINRLTKKSNNAKNGARARELDQKLVLNLQKSKIPTWRQFRHIEKVLSKKEKLVLGIISLILLASVLTVGLTFYFEHRVFVPKAGGEYIEGLVGAPQFINPIYSASNDVDMDITRLVYSGLMRITPEGSLEPDLAESYEISEDGTTYLFYLRGDARWHDGGQVTADDVIFTFDSILDPTLGSPLAVSFRSVVVEKVKGLPVGEGLDAFTGKYVNMIDSGIIDPAKVTRSALQNASSIAALLLTTEVVIADKPEKEKPAPMPPGGGMGGMGGGMPPM